MVYNVYKIDGTQSSETVEIQDSLLEKTPNDHAIYLDVKAYLANQRQGTHKAKERGEVSGSTKKPWKQKGRGTARSGATRSPLWVGGGTIFGPRPRDYRQFINKKVKKLARLSAFIYKVKSEQLVFVQDINIETPKTKQVVDIVKALNLTGKKTLLLTTESNKNVYLSGRNVERLNILEARNASTYDLLNNQKLVIEKSAFEALLKNII